MRLAEVIGRVTLARAHPALHGGRFVIALPLPRAALAGDSPDRGEDVVALERMEHRLVARVGLGVAGGPLGAHHLGAVAGLDEHVADL